MVEVGDELEERPGLVGERREVRRDARELVVRLVEVAFGDEALHVRLL